MNSIIASRGVKLQILTSSIARHLSSSVVSSSAAAAATSVSSSSLRFFSANVNSATLEIDENVAEFPREKPGLNYDLNWSNGTDS